MKKKGKAGRPDPPRVVQLEELAREKLDASVDGDIDRTAVDVSVKLRLGRRETIGLLILLAAVLGFKWYELREIVPPLTRASIAAPPMPTPTPVCVASDTT